MVAGAILLVGGASAIGAGALSQQRAPQVREVPAAAAVDPGAAPAGEIGGGRPDARVPLLERSEPIALDVPKIDVHTELMSVGLNPDGSIEVPAGEQYDLGAWYRYSPTPGELGPSVIEGHLDSHRGPSVFFRLGELAPGDQISVQRMDGSVADFRVTSVRAYAKDTFPTSDVYGDIAYAGLRLLTCGGRIDPATGHYADNVVVYATLDGTRRA